MSVGWLVQTRTAGCVALTRVGPRKRFWTNDHPSQLRTGIPFWPSASTTRPFSFHPTPLAFFFHVGSIGEDIHFDSASVRFSALARRSSKSAWVHTHVPFIHVTVALISSHWNCATRIVIIYDSVRGFISVVSISWFKILLWDHKTNGPVECD